MVAVIGRTRGLRLSGGRLELLAPRQRDYGNAFTKEICQFIEGSDPYIAGEAAHSSAGLLMADRLLNQSSGTEKVLLIGMPLLRGRFVRLDGALHIPLWTLVDGLAVLARCVLRATARSAIFAVSDGRVLFVTNARQAEMVGPNLSGTTNLVLNLRKESDTQARRGGLLSDLIEAWRLTRRLPPSVRVRMFRLRYEAARIAPLARCLIGSGMSEAILADTTGHRARLMAQECLTRGAAVIVLQHGRVANPCRYIPPAGVSYVSRTWDDLETLQSVMRQPSTVRWSVMAQRPRLPTRNGPGILICPSIIGSTERSRELKRVVQEAKTLGRPTGIRFHPDQRFARTRAALLGVRYIPSRVPLSEAAGVWGSAIVPFQSSVADDLEEAGFILI